MKTENTRDNINPTGSNDSCGAGTPPCTAAESLHLPSSLCLWGGILLLLLHLSCLQAAVHKTLHVATAGTLTTLLTAEEKTTVTHLTLSGSIDVRDMRVISLEMDALEHLDFLATNIMTYTGTLTGYGDPITYPANEIPSFVSLLEEDTVIRSIIFPATLTAIGDYAFYSCSNLTAITLPEGIQRIDGHAFSSCPKLTTVNFPESLTYVGRYAFGWSGLKEITLPLSFAGWGVGVFEECDSLRTVHFPAGLQKIPTASFAYCGLLETLHLPAGLDSIHEGTFRWCDNLREVSFPAGLKYIGYTAFSADFYYGMPFLTELHLPEGLETIDTQAFWNWSKLTEVVFPSTLKTIGASAFGSFYPPSSLVSITLPAGLESIGGGAFDNCLQLAEIVVLSATPIALPQDRDAFRNVDKARCMLRVPEGALPAYREAYGWKEFLSDDATLQSLSVSPGTLVPAFDPDTLTYTVTVANSVAAIDVTGVAKHVMAGVAGNVAGKPLEVGDNTVELDVTAKDGNTQTYTVTVHRISADAALQNLSVAANGTELPLLPAFNAELFSYAVHADSGTENVALSATARYPLAAVAGAGTYPLATGINNLTATVTAEDNFTVNVYRIMAVRPSESIPLDIPDHDYTLDVSEGYLLPEPVKTIKDYTLVLPHLTDTITVTVVPVDYPDGTVTYFIDDQPVTMPMEIPSGFTLLRVHYERNETAVDYTVSIYGRPLPVSDATLNMITLSDGTLVWDNEGVATPGFVPGVFSYVAEVPYAVDSLTLTADKTFAGDLVTITLDGVATADNSHPLAVGDNLFTVAVRSEEGAQKAYQVLAVRLRCPDAALQSLTPGVGALTPAFDPDVFAYTDTVAYAVENILLSAEARHFTATVTDTGMYRGLSAGDNLLTVYVEAQNGDILTYTVNVYRRSNDALLGDLSADAGTLAPAFAPEVFAYTDTTAYAVANMILTGVARHPGATVTAGAYPLTVGDNSCTVTVRAEDGNTQDYTVHVYRRSNDASLGNLSISPGTLVPAFRPDITAYTAGVVDDTEQVTLAAAPAHPAAALAGDGEHALTTDTEAVTLRVTAEDPAFQQDYTVTVQRYNVRLRELTVSEGFLTPSFDATNLLYMVTVPNDVSGITLSAVADDPSATVQGTGAKTLVTGINTFIIMVTAPDGITSRAYTVLVTRSAVSIALPIPDAEEDYSLELSAGIISPEPRPDVTDYTLVLPCGIDTLTAAIFPPFDYSMFATVRYFLNEREVFMPLPMPAGVTLLTVEIRVFGVTLTYHVTIVNISCSGNASLENLTVNEGTLEPAFTPNTFMYEVNVGADTEDILLSAQAYHPNATVEGDGWQSLAAGHNIFSVTVSAEDGKGATVYTVQVFRYVESADVSLKSLTVSAGMLIPDFSPDVSWYAVGVPHEVTEIDIAAEAAHPLAVVSGNVQGLPLREGINHATIVVTAEDGVTTREYPVMVYRLEAGRDRPDDAPFDGPAQLLNLSVSEGTLTPAFDPAVADYSVSVDCHVENITVNAVPPEGSLIAYAVNYKEVDMPLPVDPGFTSLHIYIVVNFEYIARYTLSISRSLDMAAIIPYWDDVLAVNVNPVTNGGYTFTSYRWLKDGEPVPGETGAYWYNNGTPFPPGGYSVEVVTTEGHTLTSCPFVISAERSSQKKEATVEVYPNPAKTHITVEIPQEVYGHPIEIYNSSGKREAVIHPSDGIPTVINIEHLVHGSYVLRIGDRSAKFIKEK